MSCWHALAYLLCASNVAQGSAEHLCMKVMPVHGFRLDTTFKCLLLCALLACRHHASMLTEICCVQHDDRDVRIVASQLLETWGQIELHALTTAGPERSARDPQLGWPSHRLLNAAQMRPPEKHTQGIQSAAKRKPRQHAPDPQPQHSQNDFKPLQRGQPSRLLARPNQLRAAPVSENKRSQPHGDSSEDMDSQAAPASHQVHQQGHKGLKNKQRRTTTPGTDPHRQPLVSVMPAVLNTPQPRKHPASSMPGKYTQKNISHMQKSSSNAGKANVQPGFHQKQLQKRSQPKDNDGAEKEKQLPRAQALKDVLSPASLQHHTSLTTIIPGTVCSAMQCARGAPHMF